MLACAAGLAMPAQAEWEPQRPIEFVIQTSPGGGSDIYTRLWIGIIEKYESVPGAAHAGEHAGRRGRRGADLSLQPETATRIT
jgi:putative tricarboxylic transport membrane protein